MSEELAIVPPPPATPASAPVPEGVDEMTRLALADLRREERSRKTLADFPRADARFELYHTKCERCDRAFVSSDPVNEWECPHCQDELRAQRAADADHAYRAGIDDEKNLRALTPSDRDYWERKGMLFPDRKRWS